MKSFTTTAAFLLLAAAMYLSGVTVASAQIPEHAPGTICATPSFWCWAQIPGVVGLQCACPSVNGSVLGVYL